MKSKTLLKGAEVTGKVRNIIERETVVADTLEECNQRLTEAEAEAGRIVIGARREARDIIADAERKAGGILKQAREEGERLKEIARQAGYAEGERGARQDIATDVGDLMDRLRQSVDEAQECLQHVIRTYEPEVVKLALHIAEHIVAAKIDADDDAVRPVVERALELAGDREHVTVRINPEDFQAVSAAIDDLRERFADNETIDVEPDARVERGGCMIQTRLGTVDARIARQLAQLYDTMMEQ